MLLEILSLVSLISKFLVAHTYLQCWPHTFFTPRVFLFSISLLFWKYKQMLLLASSREVLHGHDLYLPSTQYCKLNFEA